MSAENKEIARRFVDEVLNHRDFAAAQLFLSEKATDHLMGSLTTYLSLAAFPDFHLNIEHIISEDDYVTLLSTFTGTHRGEFLGVAPTDRGVTGRIAFNFRLAEKRIVESWTEFEPWGLLQQVGASPSE
jgi:predicted ester cyclase